MNYKKINLSDTIKDSVLNAVQMPAELETLKAQLQVMLSENDYMDIEELINEIVVVAIDAGYDAGFNTATSLLQGKQTVFIAVE